MFEFPKQKIIYGPRQIIARINQDQVISPQITLWNQQGSQVIQGTLLVIPVEEALLYVRPLYLKASGGKIPELNRVIVAYRDQIVMAETLDAALDRIFRRDACHTSTRPGQTRRLHRINIIGFRRLHRRCESRGASAPALRARDAGAARWKLGAVRRGDSVAGRNASRNVEVTASRRRRGGDSLAELAAAHAY